MYKKTPWYHSLIWKLLILLIAIGVLPIFFFSDNTITSVESYFMDQRQSALVRSANITANRVFRENYLMDKYNHDNFRATIEQRSEDENLRVIILDSMATVIVDSANQREGTSLVTPEIIAVMQGATVSSMIQANGTTRYTAVPINNLEGDLIGIVLQISSVQDINELVSAVSAQTGFLNIVTLGFAFVGSVFVAYVILNPLKRLLKTVELMSEGHLNQRVKVSGNDEFAQLCYAFNNMNDKLEKVEKNREEFVSNVSHELKTPLSSIKVLSDAILMQEDVDTGTYKEFLGDITEEIDRMNRIINDLLTLVRLDQTTSFMNIDIVDINKLMAGVAKRLKPLADIKEIGLSIDYEKEVSIRGDEMKLTLALSNLVENAIKYTSSYGEVYISINADHQHAYITVKDTGIGIPEEDLNKIFTRFYRVDKTRDRETGGTGLGLSITHSTVLHHKGSIRVNSKENEGTTFVVRLPINGTD